MPPHRRPEEVFVGRKKELARLEEAARAARGGRGRIVLVAGEAGIGKSRLLEELARSSRAAGMTVLRGECSQDSGAPPYWPWAQALRPYIASTKPRALAALLRGSASLAATAIPELAGALPGLEPFALPQEGGTQARFLLHDALTGLLVRASLIEPLLVVLEDLHWADEGSLGLFAFAARQVELARLLLVGSYRPEESTRSRPLVAAIAELARVRACDRQALGPLSDDEVAEYCDRTLPPGMPEHISRTVFGRTDGNPLFLRQMVSHLIQAGAGAAASAVLEVPAGLEETIRMRLERLEPRATWLLQVAAVLGTDLDAAQLAAAAEIEAEELVASLEQPLEARLLEQGRDRPGRLRFSHALVREGIIASLPLHERARVHARVAKALESWYGGAVEAHAGELAEHYAQAGALADTDKLVRYSLVAAEGALQSGFAEEALSQIERALACVEGREEDEQTARLHVARARALGLLGRMHDAVAAAARSFRAYRALGMKAEAATAAAVSAGCGPEELLLQEEALELAGEGTIERARLLRSRAISLIFLSDDDRRGVGMLEEALSIAERRGDTVLALRAVNGLVNTTYYHLRFDEFRAYADRMIRLATETGNDYWGVWAREQLVGWLDMEGRFDEARLHIEAAYLSADRSGLSLARDLALELDAHLFRYAGDWSRARSLVAALVDPGKPPHLRLQNLLRTLIDVELSTGNAAAGREYLNRFVEYARTTAKGSALVEKNAATETARAAYLTGQGDGLDRAKQAARELLRRPLNPMLVGGVLAGLGYAAVAEDDASAAAECWSRLTGLPGQGCDLQFPELRGAVARCAGRLEEAIQTLQAARLRFAARKPARAHVCHELGLALHQRALPQDAERARETWQEALELAHEIGMEPLAARLEARLRAAEAEGRRRAPAGLSRRELEVARLVALGKTNKEIASDLGISEKTVQAHISGIFGKVGASNRAGVATFAVRNGLISAPFPRTATSQGPPWYAPAHPEVRYA